MLHFFAPGLRLVGVLAIVVCLIALVVAILSKADQSEAVLYRGAPVADATIIALGAPLDGGNCARTSECECKRLPLAYIQLWKSQTNRNGTYLPERSAPAPEFLWIEKRGVGAMLVDANVRGAELEEGMVISGSVWVDARPPETGTVNVRAIHRDLGLVVAGTVSNSFFSIGPLPMGPYFVIASANGRPSDCTMIGPGSSGIVLNILSLCAVTGRVLVGSAPAGAIVRLGDATGSERTMATSKGEFSFDGVPPGRYSLLATNEGGNEGAFRSIEVPIGCTNAPINLPLERVRTISGRFIDSDGRSVPAVVVDLRSSSGHSQVTTGSDGRFVLPYWSEATLSAKATGFVELRRVVHSADSVEQLFRLEKGYRFGGLVADERGDPVGVARVSLRAVERVSPTYFADTTTNGTFVIDAVSPGRYEVTVKHNLLKTESMVVDVPSRDLSIVLRSGLSIVGQVRLASNIAVAGASVRISSNERDEIRWAESGQAGQFTASGVEPGRYTLTAFSAQGQGTIEATVPVDSAKLPTIVISATASIFGLVRDATGTPVPQAHVEAKGSRSGFRTDSGASGRFSFLSLPADTYRLSAWSSESRTSEDTLVAAEDGREVELVVSKMGRLTGRVVDVSGRPIKDFSLNAVDFSNQDGRFDIASQTVSERDFRRLRIVSAGYFPLEMYVVVAPGENRDVGDVVLGVGRSLQLRVTSASDRTGLGGAEIWSSFPRSKGDAFPVIVTSPQGLANLVGLPVRNAEIWVSHRTHGFAHFAIPDEARELTVSMGMTARLAVNVKSLESRPLRAKVVAANVNHTEVVVGETDEQGLVIFEPLPAGSWVVVGWGRKPPLRGIAFVVISEGGSSEVDLPLTVGMKEAILELSAPFGWEVKNAVVVPRGIPVGVDGEVDSLVRAVGAWPCLEISPGVCRVRELIGGEFDVIVTASNGALWGEWRYPLSVAADEQVQRHVYSAPAEGAIRPVELSAPP